jgi:hypothetical protein
MLYLLWALLNIGLGVFFIVVCFKATRLIREKIGLFAAFIFVFGLLSFMQYSNSDKDNSVPHSNYAKTWKFISQDSLHGGSNTFIDIQLEKTWISKYGLRIQYGKDKQLQNNIPVNAHTLNTGFRSGTSWEPISIIVNRTDDNQKFEYEVDGTVTWKLLGFTIYTQLKSWKGIALLK